MAFTGVDPFSGIVSGTTLSDPFAGDAESDNESDFSDPPELDESDCKNLLISLVE